MFQMFIETINISIKMLYNMFFVFFSRLKLMKRAQQERTDKFNCIAAIQCALYNVQ